jgi:RNA polymerase sigma-70 factor, ECF subfamily
VAPRHDELHAHCYRMLGSVHDAEDALQEALLRAWRGMRRFEGKSSLRAWLYRIATNTCLDAIGRRPRRVLPIDHGPGANPHDPPGPPLAESAWIEPYPDELLPAGEAFTSPEATYEQRESVELAFIAALQHLPARQRAVLILRAVLGFSAAEVADTLDTSVASVDSTLHVPAGPLPVWYRGRDTVAAFLTDHPLRERWRHVPTRANGQLAVGCYMWDDTRDSFVAAVIDVLTLRGDRIDEVTAFVAPWVYERFGDVAGVMTPAMFRRFGMPDELPA